MISEKYGDIYFSAQDGLAETRHVFLQGNGLPQAWADTPRFCICETGFGTGLNFLATWKLFFDTAKAGQRLDYISIEKYPLTKEQIREALLPWRDELGVYLDAMLARYPIRARGFHRVDVSDTVSLTLVFDDVKIALPQIDACVDAWFLDGFAPAKNPDMWEAPLYEQMARLSFEGTRFASFTAAGAVRRGLAENGFTVEKLKGYGRKRDMIAGRYAQAKAKTVARVPCDVAVIGGGIAGLSAAWHLQRQGARVVVYEAGADVALGASGNRLGMVNPKLTAQASPVSDYYAGAYAYALRVLAGFEDIDFKPYGALHLQVNDDKARRFEGYCENLGWHHDHMALLDAAAASEVAGVRVDVPCLYYPDAAAVSPAKFCKMLASKLDVRTNTKLDALPDADAVVVANADGVKDFFDLPVSRVRGQVSLLEPTDVSRRLRCNLSYGGYISPVIVDEGLHVCGATFQPWGTSPDVLAEDHTHNIQTLAKALPVFEGGFTVNGGRTGFRTSSKDRLPIVGDYDGAYLSVAHGSHGIVSGLMGGAMAAATLMGGPMPLGAGARKAVCPRRFR
ncbi:MAG: FAD-dependent 5-carboxymethylaminomethyl-2-thiouridine(34) oxidoreductase MnmC [Alphaproteobacteria bacterium]|nr:FAD-dependent 5-carboxymethylaminomethyl-2-thiouridine(34) oxidoreductase MnmC [Alphaproteobacteria bacterium]